MKTALEGAALGEICQQRLVRLEAQIGSVDALPIAAITALNDKRFNELLDQLTLLQACQALTQTSLEQALSRISLRLTPVEFSNVERIKIKARGDKAGILIDGVPYYFSDEKRDEIIFGGTGSVEKIYCETQTGKEFFALKKMLLPQGEESIAKKEAKYNHALFGRKTMLFKCEGTVNLVVPWFEGEALDKMNERHMKDFDEIVRVDSFLALLADIQTLHQNGRMHLDIKPSNIIFDLEKRKLHLIDFGSSLRMLSKKQVYETLGLFDRRTRAVEKPARMTQDIYSLLHVFKAVFPELGLSLGSPQAQRRVPVNANQAYLAQPHWGLMERFVKTFIQEPLGDERVTAKDVADFMLIMKKEFYTMTQERADEIIQMFKSEVRLTTDAILCGRNVLLN